ncbi:hypothetical protein [Spirochaeta africana]|uniref:Flagellar hook-length control protein FliK n=1 Tax=Spirochaeta africana (strain ATCC 700263 / DSM 8902 / Z-7692) TaxID=889378 RepID=H9UIF2_SPIAZ|nr:hypothetical protein [Spirochaeta africana]AFG37295.1 hypothetical protein Spiaf_1217 [Spirochaeta africana DSM 8902]
MEPIGRFLQAVLPLGKRSVGLQPGSTVQATVLKPLGANRWLIQAGSQRLTAHSTLQLSPHQSLKVRIEQGPEGLLFRVVEPDAQADRLAQLLHQHGIETHLPEFRSVLESLVQVGIPLSEHYTVPALEQFSRLLREHPGVQRRYREASRLIAMFSDRGLRVPDDMILELLGFGDSPGKEHGRDHPGQQQGHQSTRDEDSAASPDSDPQEELPAEQPAEGPPAQPPIEEQPAEQQPAEQQPAEQQPAEQQPAEPPANSPTDEDQACPQLQLPSAHASAHAGLSLLASLHNREHPWVVVPFRYLPGADDHLSGTIRLRMHLGRTELAILDVPTESGRWVFSWVPDAPGSLRVYTDHADKEGATGILQQLREFLANTPLAPPDGLHGLSGWDGFSYQEHTPEVKHVDAHG